MGLWQSPHCGPFALLPTYCATRRPPAKPSTQAHAVGDATRVRPAPVPQQYRHFTYQESSPHARGLTWCCMSVYDGMSHGSPSPFPPCNQRHTTPLVRCCPANSAFEHRWQVRRRRRRQHSRQSPAAPQQSRRSATAPAAATLRERPLRPARHDACTDNKQLRHHSQSQNRTAQRDGKYGGGSRSAFVGTNTLPRLQLAKRANSSGARQHTRIALH
jgi:hypothetical protein